MASLYDGRMGMPAPQQLSLTIPPHRNHGLFADHYLDHVLPARPEWGRLADDAVPVLAEITRIFAAYVPSSDEAQTEHDLINGVRPHLNGWFRKIEGIVKLRQLVTSLAPLTADQA